MYVNLLLYETAHQEYNSTFLYLLPARKPSPCGCVIDMTQDDLADILGVSRVQLTRALAMLRERDILRTHRGHIEITDRTALAAYCSLETR